MKVLLLAVATLTFAVSLSAAHDHWLAQFHRYADIAVTDTGLTEKSELLVTLWNTNHHYECLGRYSVGEVIEHPVDCHKFVSCVASRLVEITCPAGQYFANHIGLCIPDVQNKCTYVPKERNVVVVDDGCGGTVAPTEPPTCANATNLDTFPDPSNCTNYYMCADGEAVLQTCDFGQYYDSASASCVYDANAVCINPCPNQAGTLQLPNPDCSNFYLCIDGTVSVETCPTGTFDALTAECSTNGTCITALCANQPDWMTYAMPYTTTKFYACDNHTVVVRNCEPNTVYNDNIGACVSSPSSQCDQNVCSDYDGNAFPTVDDDPTAFCYCRNGAAYVESCPTNYYFDNAIASCLSNATCDEEYCLTAPEYSPTPARYQSNSFCLCVSGVAVVVDCPLNGTFNANSLKCQAVGQCDHTYCLTETDNMIYESIDNNAGFCKCVDNVGIFVPCDDGYVFNPTLNMCRPAATVAAALACDASKCATIRTTIFAIPNDPFNFCHCNGVTSVVRRSCPSDTYFDATLLMCISRKNAVAASTLGCDLSACAKAHDGRVYSIAAQTTDKSFCYCLRTDKVISLDCPAGKRYNSRLGVCVDTTQLNYLQPLNSNNGNPQALWAPKDTHFNCAGGYRHGDFIEHAQNCQHFHVCAYGKLHEMDCGVGNYFDTHHRICDWDRYGLCAHGAEIGCMGLYHEGEMIGHNTNAQLYFVCYNHQMIMQNCGPNNTFDVKRQMCVRKDVVNGGNGGARKRTPRSVPQEVARVGGQQAIAQQSPLEEKDFMHCEEHAKRSVPSNCTQYEACSEGAWQRHTCNPQRYYNPEQQKCLEPRDDYVCAYARVGGLPACNNATLHLTQANLRHGKCNSYYRCQADGKWSLGVCPKRHYYAAQLNACIETQRNAANVCGHSAAQTNHTINVIHASNTTNSINATNVIHATNAANATNTINATNIIHTINKSNTTTNATDATALELSKCQHMALRPYDSDCGMYMMCVEGVWWHNYCAYGMYFNRTLNTCLLHSNESSASLQHCSGNSLRVNCDGAEERRAFPLNCSAYEMCNAAQRQWQRASCPLGQAFDDALLACVPQTEYTLCSVNGLRRACDDGESRALLSIGSGSANATYNQTHFYYCDAEQWRVGACFANHTYVIAAHACQPNVGARNASAVDKHVVPVITPLAVEAVCAERAHGARVPHALYCNVYYACVHNVTYMAQCDEGERFDAAQQRCSTSAAAMSNNATTAAACRQAQLAPLNVQDELELTQTICYNQSAGTQLPHASDCTRYYKCNNSNQHNNNSNNNKSNSSDLLTCEAGMYYDALQRVCTNSDNACPYIKPLPSNATAIACADKHGILLADVQNCNDFYVCLNGRARHESCYETHYFNATLKQCQALPTNGDGDISIIDNASNSSNTINVGLHCTHKRRSAVEMCAELAEGASLAAPGDCRRYISCQQQANGVAQIEQRCRNGENYDSLLGRCRQSDGTCMLENGQRIGECSGRHGQAMAHARNCRAYYVCLHGQKIEMSCETHERFDARQLVCLRDEGKLCKDEVSLQRHAALMPTLNCMGLSAEHYHAIVPDDCRSYFSCVDGVPQLFYCAPDFAFDSVQQVCVPAVKVQCV